MVIYYQCTTCGALVKGKWKSSPNRGDYISAGCKCGKKGTSDWHYIIKGFNKLGAKQDWLKLKTQCTRGNVDD